ncbi:MAG: transposase [Acetobacteraceae bacterium]|nr:transposase [Acetobacteraceae bacterium]
MARELFAIQAEEYTQLQAQIDELDAKLTAWHRADECSRRLAKIPSVGPIGAVLLRLKTPAPERHPQTPSQQPIGQSYRLRPHPPTFCTLPRDAFMNFPQHGMQ